MKRAIATAFALVLAACNPDLKPLEEESARMAQDILALRTELDQLSSTVQELSFENSLSAFDEVAYLTPGDEGYSIIKYGMGYLTVSLQDVQPYASGARVKLQFGNLSSATLNDVKATVEWGKVGENGLPVSEGQQSKEMSFNSSLAAGSWTTVTVSLDRVPSTELGFVRVRGLSHGGIRLKTG